MYQQGQHVRCASAFERAIYGDSWFAGVKTAEAMLENGLRFIGDVKTNTRRFPVAELEEATTAERGVWPWTSSDGASRHMDRTYAHGRIGLEPRVVRP